MKECAHCGQRNEDGALRCVGCGTELTALPPSAPASVSGRWQRIAVLNNEVEAERLDLELQNLGVPHVMVSYRDSALDGLYQVGRGWGHVEADATNASTVISLLEDWRNSADQGL